LTEETARTVADLTARLQLSARDTDAPNEREAGGALPTDRPVAEETVRSDRGAVSAGRAAEIEPRTTGETGGRRSAGATAVGAGKTGRAAEVVTRVAGDTVGG
jgi:hypothetical protein